MHDDQSRDTPIDKPFQRLAASETNRTGETHAQTLPAGRTGDYLIVQRDDSGVRLEQRQRYKKYSRGRLHNRYKGQITLTEHDADQLAAIMQGLSAEQSAASQAEAAREDAEQRWHNASNIAKYRFKQIKQLRERRAVVEQRAQAAEAQLAELAWLRERVARLRSLTDRLPQSVQTRLVHFMPTGMSMNQSASSQSTRSAVADIDPGQQVFGLDYYSDAGERFLAWLKASIAHRTLPINAKKHTAVHTLPSGLFLVSPLIFKMFDPTNGRHVQKRFQKLQLHTRNPQDGNIWGCHHQHGQKGKRLKGLLIRDAEDVLGLSLPAPNSRLTLDGAADETPCA